MRPGHCQPRAAGERGLAGQTLVEETAERVDIRAAVDRPAFDLLGGEVGGRAHGAALARWAALLVESSGQSEVGEIDVLTRIEQHVGGLDVPMDETFRVCRIQGVRDLAADGKRARRVERPLRVKERPQVCSLDVAHREVEATVDVACVVDRHHVRVLERHREFRLAREALAEALIQRQLGRHQLQRDCPFQPQVVGAVDDAHPTAADQLVDPVADELGADPDLCLSAHGISRPPDSSLRRCRRPARMVDAGAEAPLSLG